MNIIIGGEHIILPSHFLKKSRGYIDRLVDSFDEDYYVNFTFGGYYSLLAIIDSIKNHFEKDSFVLLPSYLCPSILKPFKLKGIPFKFYKVDHNLFIDTDHLNSIIDDKVKAILFIDYFGASQLNRINPLLDALKSKKIIIIQDVVQCLELRKELLFGDYIFNSFRKFYPFEGSILLSKNQMNIHFSKTNINYLVSKRMGQMIRYFHVKYQLFSSRHFLFFLKKAENLYCSDLILKMPKFNIQQLNKYNIEEILEKHKYYYNQLFTTYKELVPKLIQNTNCVPMGFVIKISNRDSIREKLFKQMIFPPIHWTLPNEIKENSFSKSVNLSKSILTIPLIGLNSKKFKYLLKNIQHQIRHESIS